MPSHDSQHIPVIPDDVIERAARGFPLHSFIADGLYWEEIAEQQRGWRRAAARSILRASGLPARVAELEAALRPFAALARVIDTLRHEPGSTCPHRLAADDIRRAHAVLNAKGAPDA